MTGQNASLVGPLCSFGSSVTWAIGSAGYSRLSKTYSAFAVNFSRALIALPMFILAAFIVSGGISQGIAHYSNLRWSHWAWFALSIFSSYGLGDALFLLSTRSLGLPGALAIGSCFPIWTVAAGCLLGQEVLTMSHIIGVLLTITGVVVVILNGPNASRDSQGFSWSGIFLALITSVLWATNSFASAQGGIDVLAPVGNTVRMGIALILSSFFGRVFAPHSAVCLPKSMLARYFWLFVFEAFIGSYCYLYGLSHSPLALGSTLASLAPVISVPVALAFGLEKFSLRRTMGVTLVVVGVWFLMQSF